MRTQYQRRQARDDAAAATAGRYYGGVFTHCRPTEYSRGLEPPMEGLRVSDKCDGRRPRLGQVAVVQGNALPDRHRKQRKGPFTLLQQAVRGARRVKRGGRSTDRHQIILRRWWGFQE